MKRLCYFFLIAVFLFFADGKVFAKSYSISPVTIEANLNADGSMNVKETRTFHFDGDFTFAYQKINALANQSTNPGRKDKYHLSNFSLCDTRMCYRQLANNEIANADDLRPQNTFYVLDNTNDYFIKWFYRSSSSATFTHSYTVNNAVTLQTDTAELYWQLVGDEWEIGQQKINASIALPRNIDLDNVKAWAHGPTSGQVSITSEGQINYQLASLPSGQFFEARIVMPKIGICRWG